MIPNLHGSTRSILFYVILELLNICAAISVGTILYQVYRIGTDTWYAVSYYTDTKMANLDWCKLCVIRRED